MSLLDAIKSAARDELAELVGRLPVEAIRLLIQLAMGALKSGDPVRYLERRAAADASGIAAETTIATALRATKPQS